MTPAVLLLAALAAGPSAPSVHQVQVSYQPAGNTGDASTAIQRNLAVFDDALTDRVIWLGSKLPASGRPTHYIVSTNRFTSFDGKAMLSIGIMVTDEQGKKRFREWRIEQPEKSEDLLGLACSMAYNVEVAIRSHALCGSLDGCTKGRAATKPCPEGRRRGHD